MMLTPQQFITKWSDAMLKERSAAQEHFIDLCRMFGQPTPAEADAQGAWYTFEKGADKTSGVQAPPSGQPRLGRPDPEAVDEETILTRLLKLNQSRKRRRLGRAHEGNMAMDEHRRRSRERAGEQALSKERGH